VSARVAGSDGDTLVIIPAYNERTRIAAILQRLRAVAPTLDVLVVDDGSSDDTAAVAGGEGVCVLSHPFNLGYGAAVQSGYKWAVRHAYAYVVQLDGDGQHDPEDVVRLLAPLRAGTADVAIGSRFIEPSGYEMGAARSVGRRLFAVVLRLFGGPRIADPTSGFQAMVGPAFALCCGDFFPSDFPDVDVLLALARNGMRIVEVPVTMRPNPASHVSMHAGRRALYYPYKMLLATYRSALTPRIAAAERAPAEGERGGS
jgi:glycosyltransferase involved in cell wall biosynthesis